MAVDRSPDICHSEARFSFTYLGKDAAEGSVIGMYREANGDISARDLAVFASFKACLA
jgi:hypothetical protein